MSFSYSTLCLHRHHVHGPICNVISLQHIMFAQTSCSWKTLLVRVSLPACENEMAMLTHVSLPPLSSQSCLLCSQVLLRKAKKMASCKKAVAASMKQESGSVMRWNACRSVLAARLNQQHGKSCPVDANVLCGYHLDSRGAGHYTGECSEPRQGVPPEWGWGI